jgi:hypothetical protein
MNVPRLPLLPGDYGDAEPTHRRGYLCSAVYYAKLFPAAFAWEQRPFVRRLSKRVSILLRARELSLFSALAAHWRSQISRENNKRRTTPALDGGTEMDRWKDYTIDFLAKHKLRSLLVSDSVLELMRPALCPGEHHTTPLNIKVLMCELFVVFFC